MSDNSNNDDAAAGTTVLSLLFGAGAGLLWGLGAGIMAGVGFFVFLALLLSIVDRGQ